MLPGRRKLAPVLSCIHSSARFPVRSRDPGECETTIGARQQDLLERGRSIGISPRANVRRSHAFEYGSRIMRRFPVPKISFSLCGIVQDLYALVVLPAQTRDRALKVESVDGQYTPGVSRIPIRCVSAACSGQSPGRFLKQLESSVGLIGLTRVDRLHSREIR